MGFAGGLVPSPSALVVLLGAVGLGRAWFGLLLVTAYGLGLAITLTAAGLLIAFTEQRVRGWASRSSGTLVTAFGPMLRAAPMLSAAGLVCGGVYLVSRTLLAG
jgi:nickel/cobalt transporter (NicO) family protein